MNASVNDDYHTTYTEPDASTFAPMYDGMFETDTDGSDESINVSEGMPDDAKSTDAGTDAVLMDTTDLGPDSLGPSTYSPVSNAAQHNTSVPKPQVTEFINSADIQADPTPTPPNVQRDAHAALNSVLEQTNANTLSMLFSLILLWVNAICFTGHIWYHVAMRTMYTITTILAFACPVQINPKKPDKFEAKLSNGTMLYSLCNPISPRAMLNSITSESLANMFGRKRKSGLAANDPQPQAHSSRAIPNVPPEKENEMLMVADSGANPEQRREKFMFRVEEMDQTIGGMCTDNQAKTSHYGIFAATAKEKNGSEIPFTSVAFAVKGGRKPLFSEVQCCFAGNTVLHKGHPETGTHGIFLAESNYFIPYEWSAKEHCWYLRLTATSQAHCMRARAKDPRAELRE